MLPIKPQFCAPIRFLRLFYIEIFSHIRDGQVGVDFCMAAITDERVRFDLTVADVAGQRLR
jgi:hypothetical protein